MGTAIEALQQKHYAVAQAAMQLRHAVVQYEIHPSAPNLSMMREARRDFDAAAARPV